MEFSDFTVVFFNENMTIVNNLYIANIIDIYVITCYAFKILYNTVASVLNYLARVKFSKIVSFVGAAEGERETG